MPESTSLGRLLVLAGVAVWLGSPSVARRGPGREVPSRRRSRGEAARGGQGRTADLAPSAPGRQARPGTAGWAARISAPESVRVRGRASRGDVAHFHVRRAGSVDPRPAGQGLQDHQVPRRQGHRPGPGREGTRGGGDDRRSSIWLGGGPPISRGGSHRPSRHHHRPFAEVSGRRRESAHARGRPGRQGDCAILGNLA